MIPLGFSRKHRKQLQWCKHLQMRVQPTTIGALASCSCGAEVTVPADTILATSSPWEVHQRIWQAMSRIRRVPRA